jgi:hypothetical protein
MPDIGPKLNSVQKRVLDELFSPTGPRPVSPKGIAEELSEIILARTGPVLGGWPDSSFWFGKSTMSSLSKCEGTYVGQLLERENQSKGSARMFPATAAGIVAHRAIQIAHTHHEAGYLPEQLVKLAVAGAITEESFSDFWTSAPTHTQSDVLTKAVGATVGFLDMLPPLSHVWVPRFEESLIGKVGKLTMSSRVDLILGRPRADGRRTIMIFDVKTTDIRDNHRDEALLYALISTLRHGVMPYRSTVLSLASGEWTDPDFNDDELRDFAAKVGEFVVSGVELGLESREPILTPGDHCLWCPARKVCHSSAVKGSDKESEMPVQIVERREVTLNLPEFSGSSVAASNETAETLNPSVDSEPEDNPYDV